MNLCVSVEFIGVTDMTEMVVRKSNMT